MFTPMEEHEMHAPKRYLHFCGRQPGARVHLRRGLQLPRGKLGCAEGGAKAGCRRCASLCPGAVCAGGRPAPLSCGHPTRFRFRPARQCFLRWLYPAKGTGARVLHRRRGKLELHANDCPIVLSAKPMKGAQGQLLAESCEGFPGRAELLKGSSARARGLSPATGPRYL